MAAQAAQQAVVFAQVAHPQGGAAGAGHAAVFQFTGNPGPDAFVLDPIGRLLPVLPQRQQKVPGRDGPAVVAQGGGHQHQAVHRGGRVHGGAQGQAGPGRDADQHHALVALTLLAHAVMHGAHPMLIALGRRVGVVGIEGVARNLQGHHGATDLAQRPVDAQQLVGGAAQAVQQHHGRAGLGSLGHGLQDAPSLLLVFMARENHDTYSEGSTTRVSSVAVTSPPMTTMASGRWVSEPISRDSAMGSRPRAASMAVISTVRRRCIEPMRAASYTVWPALRNCWNTESITTPLSTAWPLKAMKPMAADTDSGMPKIQSATKPPTRARGTLSRISEAILKDLKASNSSTKISSSEIGTTTDRRFMARSWFSNSPDQFTT